MRSSVISSVIKYLCLNFPKPGIVFPINRIIMLNVIDWWKIELSFYKSRMKVVASRRDQPNRLF